MSLFYKYCFQFVLKSFQKKGAMSPVFAAGSPHVHPHLFSIVFRMFTIFIFKTKFILTTKTNHLSRQNHQNEFKNE